MQLPPRKLSHCLQGCLTHGTSLFIAPVVMLQHIAVPAGLSLTVPPKTQRQELTLGANNFSPHTANRAKSIPAPC